MIPLIGSTHHICVYVPWQDVYFQHHMSCFYVFREIIKEVIVRFVDICEIDDLSLYKLSFYNNTSTYRPSATICVHITVDINDICIIWIYSIDATGTPNWNIAAISRIYCSELL